MFKFIIIAASLILFSCAGKVKKQTLMPYGDFYLKNHPGFFDKEELSKFSCEILSKEPLLAIRKYSQSCKNGGCPEDWQSWLCGKAMSLKQDQKYYLRAMYYVSRGDFKSSEDTLNKAIELNPKEKEYLYRKGLLLEKSGQEKKSLSYYQKALKIAPDHLGAKLHYKFVSWRQSKSTPRQYDLSKVIGPDISRSLLKYSQLNMNRVFNISRYFKEDQLSEIDKAIKLINQFDAIPHAVSTLDTLIEQVEKKNKSFLYHIKGLALLRLDRKGEAITAFRNGVESNPFFPDNHCELFNIYSITRVKDRADENFEKCFSLNPFSEKYLRYKAESYLKLGQARSAQNYARAIYLLNSNYLNAHLWALTLYRQKLYGELDTLLETWRERNFISEKIMILKIYLTQNKGKELRAEDEIKKEMSDLINWSLKRFPSSNGLKKIKTSYEKTGFLPSGPIAGVNY